MTANFDYLYHYLEKEVITIDKAEFELQIQSHPDYPSLLAIADTLSFFNIPNVALRIEVPEIELLPDRFITLLNEENQQPQLYFIEQKEENYSYVKDKDATLLSSSELKSRWNNIVLLVEKPETGTIPHTSKNKGSWILPLCCGILFVSAIYQLEISTLTQVFFIFPILGMLFSITALKDLFGTKNELLNSFCTITSATSCTTVIDSTKWKLFKFINFSDLSIIFFTSQVWGLLVLSSTGNTIGFFSIQKIILIGATPILLLSLYYQKFIAKKWCPICLVIIFLILSELVYIMAFETALAISLPSVIYFSFVFCVVTTVWFALKKILVQQKELKEFQIKGTRFIRNYEIFKNTLLASTSIDNRPIVSGSILLGNPDAALQIIVVTNPFCGYCKEAHAVIEDILAKYHDTVCFDIRFNYNSEYPDEKFKKVHEQLIAIYYEKGQQFFRKALHDWFENKEEEKLYAIPITSFHEMKINALLDEQFQWNQKNNLTYTPAFIIHGYMFPKQYERKELIHFIAELAEDEDF